MRRATLVTSDPATGLRRGPIRWPDGKPPTPFGCRRCGHPAGHHGLGAHQWERPTKEQMLARMKARREQRLAPPPAPVFDGDLTGASIYIPAGPPCIPDHGAGGWCPGCAHDSTES